MTTIRERVEQGGTPLWGAFLGTGSPLLAELMSRSGFDWLVIDMQHAPVNSSSELLSLVQAVSLGQSAPFLRAPWKTQFGAIIAALNAGVEGVIIPMLDTAEEAEQIAAVSATPSWLSELGTVGAWPWPPRATRRDGSPTGVVPGPDRDTRHGKTERHLGRRGNRRRLHRPPDLRLPPGRLELADNQFVLHGLCEPRPGSLPSSRKIPVAHTADPNDAPVGGRGLPTRQRHVRPALVDQGTSATLKS